MKRMFGGILGIVAAALLAGCSSYHSHHGMMGGATGDAYWQKGRQDMAALIDRTVKDPDKAKQVNEIVGEIVEHAVHLGRVVDIGRRAMELQEIELNLPAAGRAAGEVVPVTLAARVTDIGTLELNAVPVGGSERWKVEFDARAGKGRVRGRCLANSLLIDGRERGIDLCELGDRSSG